MPGLMWKQALAESLKPLIPRRLALEARSHQRCDGYVHDTVVASYNIHKCVGQDGVFDPGRVARVIAELNAEVVALQEVDQRFGDRAGLLDLDSIRDRSGVAPVALTPTRKGHGWHGNLVLVRDDIRAEARQIALPGGEPRGALFVELELSSGPLRLVAAHLGLLRRSRALQVKTILAEIGDGGGVPTLLVGDLNEWRQGDRSSLLRLEEAFAGRQPLLPSFPAGCPVLPLDRVIASHPGLVTRMEVHDTPLAHLASDHLPVKAWVRLPQDEATTGSQKMPVEA
jgi:endonuclease/exonuclease/phosphatase family metal-dependent hydrolase